RVRYLSGSEIVGGVFADVTGSDTTILEDLWLENATRTNTLDAGIRVRNSPRTQITRAVSDGGPTVNGSGFELELGAQDDGESRFVDLIARRQPNRCFALLGLGLSVSETACVDSVCDNAEFGPGLNSVAWSILPGSGDVQVLDSRRENDCLDRVVSGEARARTFEVVERQEPLRARRFNDWCIESQQGFEQ
ncbi:MAG: hypothetical protein AAFQ82_08810, partial [Myxococcota bacterium]